jgi:hypothetical protein
MSKTNLNGIKICQPKLIWQLLIAGDGYGRTLQLVEAHGYMDQGPGVALLLQQQQQHSALESIDGAGTLHGGKGRGGGGGKTTTFLGR